MYMGDGMHLSDERAAILGDELVKGDQRVQDKSKMLKPLE